MKLAWIYINESRTAEWIFVNMVVLIYFNQFRSDVSCWRNNAFLRVKCISETISLCIYVAYFKSTSAFCVMNGCRITIWIILKRVLLVYFAHCIEILAFGDVNECCITQWIILTKILVMYFAHFLANWERLTWANEAWPDEQLWWGFGSYILLTPWQTR